MKRLSYFCPPETTAKLRSPERGFYSILRFTADEAPAMPEDTARHPDDTLILVEINLVNYSASALSERALSGIQSLFDMLRSSGCGLIVRFLYDWSGRNIITEPKSVDIILGHIGQLGAVIRKNADIIFLLQGLFIGNWGEMHGSRFLRGDLLKRLYAALSEATENRVQIAVRTPALWRAVTGVSVDSQFRFNGSFPGLFNDGMLGNDSEYGTYCEDLSEREEELRLQKTLCRFVPYGGEVVGTEPQSDAERAMEALKRTGVSYLNRLYDENTLDKWRNTAVDDGSIWNGMSYFDYAQAHIGYRFVIRSVSLRRSAFSESVTAKIRLENTGFAPVYHAAAAELVFVCENRESVFPLEEDISRLFRDTVAVCLSAKLPLTAELSDGSYDIYFRLKSLKYNVTIPTANQGSCGKGCLVGRYTG